MKRESTQDELIERWTLAPSELVLLMNKSGPGRVGFAALLKLQDADGSWGKAGSWGSGPVFTTSIYCIILQLENNPRMGGGR